MKFKVLLGIAILAVVMILNSCENKSVPLPVLSLAIGCDTLNLTYSSGSNTMKAIIDLECATNNSSCHAPGGASGYDFSSYSAGGLQLANTRHYLYGDLVNGVPHPMPLTPQPGWADSSTCMIAKFKAWINAGIPQ